MSKTNEVVFFQNKLFNGITIIRLSVSSRSTQIFFISLVFAPCFLRRIQKLWRRLAQRIMAKRAATCTTDYGQEYNLVVTENGNLNNYECVCKGVGTTTLGKTINDVNCILYYLACPIQAP